MNSSAVEFQDHGDQITTLACTQCKLLCISATVNFSNPHTPTGELPVPPLHAPVIHISGSALEFLCLLAPILQSRGRIFTSVHLCVSLCFFPARYLTNRCSQDHQTSRRNVPRCFLETYFCYIYFFLFFLFTIIFPQQLILIKC